VVHKGHVGGKARETVSVGYTAIEKVSYCCRIVLGLTFLTKEGSEDRQMGLTASPKKLDSVTGLMITSLATRPHTIHMDRLALGGLLTLTGPTSPL
jgi:hypothetical protein